MLMVELFQKVPTVCAPQWAVNRNFFSRRALVDMGFHASVRFVFVPTVRPGMTTI
jgi:hypothetical protein